MIACGDARLRFNFRGVGRCKYVQVDLEVEFHRNLYSFSSLDQNPHSTLSLYKEVAHTPRPRTMP